ncbi:MAG: GGDEF domain-containing protein [Amphritea sp.]|nr:GGDEF domain-containing protein [Amphritea sp.]
MLPIDEFFESLDKNISNNILTVNNQITALFNEIFIALFVITFVFIGYLFMLVKAFNQHLRIVEKLSRTDPLTNIRNRRSFFELAEQILIIAKRTKQPLSLLMIDIDLFKEINDTYGHIIGDEILLSLVNSIKQNIRKSDA